VLAVEFEPDQCPLWLVEDPDVPVGPVTVPFAVLPPAELLVAALLTVGFAGLDGGPLALLPEDDVVDPVVETV